LKICGFGRTAQSRGCWWDSQFAVVIHSLSPAVILVTLLGHFGDKLEGFWRKTKKPMSMLTHRLFMLFVVRPAGFEPAAYGLEVNCP